MNGLLPFLNYCMRNLIYHQIIYHFNYIQSNTTAFPRKPISTRVNVLFSLDPSFRGILSYTCSHVSLDFRVWKYGQTEGQWLRAQEGAASSPPVRGPASKS